MKNLIIVDDFYKNPQLVRDFALQNDWIEKKQLNQDFPGTESRRCNFSTEVVRKISDLVGFKITPEPRKHAFGAFALTTEEDNNKRTIHIDGCDWTGVVYLTPGSNAKGGTSLYRHLATGLNSVPTNDKLNELGYERLEDFMEHVLKKDGHNFEKWEVDNFIEMQFNRFILFRGGQLFHSADYYFGSNLIDGRLVQLFFFNQSPTVAP